MTDQAAMSDAVRAMTDPSANAVTAPLDEFVTAYEANDHLWWVIGCGYHQNLFDAAMERVESLEAELTRSSVTAWVCFPRWRFFEHESKFCASAPHVHGRCGWKTLTAVLD